MCAWSPGSKGYQCYHWLAILSRFTELILKYLLLGKKLCAGKLFDGHFVITMAASNVRDWLKNVELYTGEDSEDDTDTSDDDNYIDDGEDLDIPSYVANSSGVVDIVFTDPDINDNVDIHDVVAPDGSNANVVVVDEIKETLWKDDEVEFLHLPPIYWKPWIKCTDPR